MARFSLSQWPMLYECEYPCHNDAAPAMVATACAKTSLRRCSDIMMGFVSLQAHWRDWCSCRAHARRHAGYS